MVEDDTIAKVFLTVIILAVSGLTSFGTAGVSGIVGLGAILLIWGYDAGEIT